MASVTSLASYVKGMNADAITGETNGAGFAGTIIGFSQATAAKRPVYNQRGFFNRACLTFNGSSTGLASASDAALNTAFGGDFSITCVYRSTNASLQTLFAKMHTGDSRVFVISHVGQFGRFFSSSLGGNYATNIEQVAHYTYNNTTHVETIYLNGVRVQQVTNTIPSLSATAYSIGSNDDFTNYFFNGDIAQIHINNAVLTGDPGSNDALATGQIAADYAYWQSYYPKTNVNVFNAGNSRTSGKDTTIAVTAQSPYPYPLQMNMLYPDLNVTNRGHSGDKIADTLSKAATEIFPYFGGLSINIVALWSGVNDSPWQIPGSDPAVKAAAFIALANAYEAKRWKLVVTTDADYLTGDASQAAYRAWRATYNAAIVAGLPSIAGSRALVRADLNALVGIDGASASTTYFSDTIHMRGQDGSGNPGGGYAVMASLIGAGVAQLVYPTEAAAAQLVTDQAAAPANARTPATSLGGVAGTLNIAADNPPPPSGSIGINL